MAATLIIESFEFYRPNGAYLNGFFIIMHEYPAAPSREFTS